MSSHHANIELTARSLVRAIDDLLEFVRVIGPHEEYIEYGKEWRYESEPGRPMEEADMNEIVRLDALIQVGCQSLNIAIPGKRESSTDQSRIEFGYTGLLIHSMYGFVQPYHSVTLCPNADWEYRMGSLRHNAVQCGGIAGPYWDGENELSYDGKLIKKYKKHPAKNHKTLLDAFQIARWANIIPNPFNDQQTADSPGRTLAATCRSMKKIPSIEFIGAGDGKAEWKIKSPRKKT